jgi:hypothetical protein
MTPAATAITAAAGLGLGKGHNCEEDKGEKDLKQKTTYSIVAWFLPGATRSYLV